MCGIAGILRVHPPGAAPPPPEIAIPEGWLDILDDSIRHRGPDGQGRFRDRAVRPDGTIVDVALVHRRLAIIDLKDGHQPMVSPRGRNESEGLVAVVFNGCIYNHRELRKELQAAGHRFETDHADTEVLIHGWREWKAGLFGRVVGMVACAIWERATGELLGFRSSPGERPLYRAETSGDVHAFASTAAGLARLGRKLPWDASLDTPDTLQRWIAFGQTPGATPLGGVDQPPFGTVVGLGNRTEDSAAEFEEGGEIRGGSQERARRAVSSAPNSSLADRLDALIGEAVAARVEADVPLGCLLSGGVDSSLIAAHAVRRVGRLTTVCVRMPFPEYDESRHAEIAAKAIGSEHRVVDASPRPAEELVSLIHAMGLPFGDSSLLPTYWACRAAKREVGVALSGDGGDELFFGYERYRAADIARALGWFAWLVPLSLIPRRDPKGRGDRAARLLIAARQRSSESLRAIFQGPDLAGLLGKDVNARIGWGLNFGGSASRRHELYSNLQGDMLRKLDAAAYMAQLEIRAPFLDQTLVLATHDLSAFELMPRGQRKGLLRQVARKYLPAEIVDRPKQGFAIPIGEWFRSDYGGMKQLLMDHLNSAEPWGPLRIELNMKFVRQMLDEHMGTRPSGRVVRDHSQRLYMLLVLSIWAKWLGSLC